MVISSAKEENGFFDWLRSLRVKEIEENLFGHNLHKAQSKYIFGTQQYAKTFIKEFRGVQNTKFDMLYGEVFFDKNLKNYCISISQNSQRILKQIFFYSVAKPGRDIVTQQMKLLEYAAKKITKYDAVSKTYTEQTRSYPQGKTVEQNVSRIEKIALLLRNEDENDSDLYAAYSAVDLMISTYLAENYSILSAIDREKISQAQKALLDVDSGGNFMGLKRDANFISYLTEKKEISNVARSVYLQEDLKALLFGGTRDVVKHDTQTFFKTTQTTQLSFFPTEDGTETQNYIVFHGGGSSNSSSIRVLKKEYDINVPGCYRYFYTKIDPGKDAEEFDEITSTVTGIYTTEILPKFGFVEQDGKVVFSDKELEQKEFMELKKNPKKYVDAMKITIFELLSADRHLIFLNTESTNVQIYNEYNKRIKKLRGDRVDRYCVTTPQSQSKNISVHSIMRTIQYFTGDFIAGDMLQSFKQYDQNYYQQLLEQKAKLGTHKQKLEERELVESNALRFQQNDANEAMTREKITQAESEARKSLDAKQQKLQNDANEAWGRKEITQAESKAAIILHDKQSKLQTMQQKIIAEREAKAKILRGPTLKDAPWHVRLVGREYDWRKQQHSTTKSALRKEMLRDLYKGNSKDKGGPSR